MTTQTTLIEFVEEFSEVLLEEYTAIIEWWLSPDLWFLGDGDPLGYAIKIAFALVAIWVWVWFEHTYLLVQPDEETEEMVE